MGLRSPVGAGAGRASGRWNEPGQASLYLSGSHATAIAKYQQNLPCPGTLTAYDVTAAGIRDLADPAIRTAIGLADEVLRQPWKYVRDVERGRPGCWDFAAAAFAHGWPGIRVPSVQAPGCNLVRHCQINLPKLARTQFSCWYEPNSIASAGMTAEALQESCGIPFRIALI